MARQDSGCPDRDDPQLDRKQRRGTDDHDKKGHRVAGAEPRAREGQAEFIVERRAGSRGGCQPFAIVADGVPDSATPLRPLAVDGVLLTTAG